MNSKGRMGHMSFNGWDRFLRPYLDGVVSIALVTVLQYIVTQVDRKQPHPNGVFPAYGFKFDT